MSGGRMVYRGIIEPGIQFTPVGNRVYIKADKDEAKAERLLNKALNSSK